MKSSEILLRCSNNDPASTVRHDEFRVAEILTGHSWYERGEDPGRGEIHNVHVEASSNLGREATRPCGCSVHSVARGIDCEQRRLLPGGDGLDGYAFLIEGRAAAASENLFDERAMPLLLSAPRRPAQYFAAHSRSMEPGARRLPWRGTSSGRQARLGSKVAGLQPRVDWRACRMSTERAPS
jgi:hypothetical protein